MRGSKIACVCFCMKWHGFMVSTERTEMAAVSHGTSCASTVITPHQWIFKNMLYKASHSHRITCKCNESAREQRMALYKSDQQPAMCVSWFVLAVRLVSKGTSVHIHFSSPFSSKRLWSADAVL